MSGPHLIDLLAPQDLGEGRFDAPLGPMTVGDNVFGGQMLAQLAFAAQRSVGDQPLTSMHVVFPRPARAARASHIDVEPIHRGRNATMVQLMFRQDLDLCATALCTALAPQHDVVPAQVGAGPSVGPPADATPLAQASAMGFEARIADGVDLGDDLGGLPAEIDLWVALPDGVGRDRAALRALIAYASEPWFAGTALRPVAGYSQSAFGSEIVPAVLTHHLAFHRNGPVHGDWLLFRIGSPVLRHGRVHGQGMVFDENGDPVAAISQENLFRPVRR